MARRDKVLTRRNGITRIIFSLYLFDIFGTVAHTRSNNYIPTFPSIPLAYLVLARPPHPTRSFVYLFISFEGLFYSWVKVERCYLALSLCDGHGGDWVRFVSFLGHNMCRSTRSLPSSLPLIKCARDGHRSSMASPFITSLFRAL